MIAGPHPDDLTNYERQNIITIFDWTKGNLDRYVSSIVCTDIVLTVDTLALHVAIGCKKPGVGFFALSEPSNRLQYSPEIYGVKPIGVEGLRYWNKHKCDENWDTHKKLYEAAWESVDISSIIDKIKII